MKKRIVAILVLMTLCTVGITGLQLYWNYQNYLSTCRNFEHDTNEALQKAAVREMELRRAGIVTEVKKWLYDTSIVQISLNSNNRLHEPVFTLKDTRSPIDKKGISLGIATFKEPLDSITPAAKKIFIDHFAGVTVNEDLKKGIVYFYTQRLGDSLAAAMERSRIHLPVLRQLYTEELRAKNINSPFLFNPPAGKWYVTQPVNLALRQPYQKEIVTAGLEQPHLYFLDRMKWLIVSSLLLILVTFACYFYTVSTLLSQDKLNRMKDDFISNMTHELNTPIAAIRITTEALLDRDHSDHDRSYLEIISQQNARLASLSTQVLRGQQAAHLGAHFRKTDLKEVVATALEELSAQTDHSGAGITTQVDGEVIVKGDRGSLENVLVNLIDNAIKYSDDKPQLRIHLYAERHHAMIVVADEGMGIPKEYQSRVFDKFFRVPKGNRHDVKGYGLGLNYVHTVVTAHRGTIRITDNTPRGTVFTIRIPLA